MTITVCQETIPIEFIFLYKTDLSIQLIPDGLDESDHSISY